MNPPPSLAEDLLAAIADVRRELERHVSALDPNAGTDTSDTSETDTSETENGRGLLPRIGEIFSLTPFEQRILALCAAVEVDASIASLCRRAQVDGESSHASFGLALAAFPNADWRALLPDAPLRYWRLVHLADPYHLTTSELRIDERVLHFLLGLRSRDAYLLELLEPAGQEQYLLSPSHRRLVELIAATWKRTAGSPEFPVVELCGPDPACRRALAEAVCEALGTNLETMAAEVLPTSSTELGEILRRWHRETLLGSTALYIEGADLEPTDPRAVSLRQVVDRCRGPLFIGGSRRLSSRRRPVLSLDVEKPTAQEQAALWRSFAEFSDLQLDGDDIDHLIGTFRLSAEQIRGAFIEAQGRADAFAAAPPENPAPIPLELLWTSCQHRARPTMGNLAQRIEPRAEWDDLILPESQQRALRDIAVHMRHRGTVFRRWGLDDKTSRGLGTTALFAGPPGTGKTFAAEILAGELGLDLYRIDLSSVVSKYIGETEKNLQGVFDAAESGGAILLFDEADALFGRRSEVKDSHDRHANIEVSYLLQRMETYDGLAILTTNLRDSLDPAFQRRLQFIVEIPFPDPVQRRAIWGRAFPPRIPLAEIDYDRLARVHLSGGQIRNIVLHAAFLAADSGLPLGMSELYLATRRELAKLNRPIPESEMRDWIS